MEKMKKVSEKQAAADFEVEGKGVEVRLLRALVMGSRRSDEIQLLLDSQAKGKADYQALAFALADLSLTEARARDTFEGLKRHQARLQEALGRPVGIKAATLDYLELIERALGLNPEEQTLSYSQLAQMAFSDHLTGLPNYRYFTRRFADEIKRAQRYHHLVSLIFLDIDHFKRFNDRFGHPAGNQALEWLAGVLRGEARETDLCVRYGGEEFAVIMPETSKPEAMEVAERIRAAVESGAVPLEDAAPQSITVSQGVATFPVDAGDLDSLLKAADQALYAAKNGGRNRVCVFTPPNKVVLRYAAPAGTHSVQVVGDFNGWNRKAFRMERLADGDFSIGYNMAPGIYAYKFFVNGERFVPDPACKESAPDGYGGLNSILRVSEGE
jgi:diguanylate cyclase (GGDEF)-like protein